MAKRSLGKDYIIYISVRAASILISSLPSASALWVGRVIGMFMYHFHPKRKRIAYANLKAAFSREKAPSELKRILKNNYANYGQGIIEILRLPKMDIRYVKECVKIEGVEQIDKALARGKGVIFLASHFGNWELSGLKSTQIGYPIYILTRAQKFKRLDTFLNSYRERLGSKVMYRGMGPRDLIKALKENKVVAMVTDQDAGKDGVFIDFLGRPASHPVGAARLARDTGAVILPVFTIREKGHRHLIRLEEPIAVPKRLDRYSDIKEGLEKHARIAERYIRRYPDQWYWIYTRWKSTPSRKVVILSDGKRGHLNQSLAALEVIKRCRRDSGYTDEDTHVEIIEVRFKNRLARTMLSFCARFAHHSCQGCMKCLKHSLDKDSYQRFMETYADIIISCGSSLAAVNIFLTRENNAKNVVVMKPGIAGAGNFEVVIIPKHDRPRERDNVVITEGSPNLISDDLMREGGDVIRGIAALGDKKRLGLLLGGDTPEYKLTVDLAGRLVDQIEDALEKSDMELLITTSRRTPKAVEKILKRRFNSNPRLKLLVIANEKNIENTVGGILDLCDVVLVSGESVSMVSEAASSGKHTVVFDLEKKKGSSKHDYAMERLTSLDFIVRAPVENINEIITQLSQREKPPRRLDNGEKMYEKLYRII